MLHTLDYCLDFDKYIRIGNSGYYRERDLTYTINVDRYRLITDYINSLPSFGLLYFSIYSIENVSLDIYKSILYRIKDTPDTTLSILANVDIDNVFYRNRLIYYCILDMDYIKPRKIKTTDIVDYYKSLAIGLTKARKNNFNIDIAIARDSNGDILDIKDKDREIALYYITDLARVYLNNDKLFRMIKEK